MSLADMYHLKSDRAFDEIERRLHELQSELATARDELRALKTQKRADLPYPIGHRWVFDAADAAYFTDSLSEAEEVEPGVFKRWVLGNQPFEIRLRLRRDLGYVVMVHLADIHKDAKISASVDGHSVPVRLEERTLRFVAPYNMARFESGDGLSLKVSLDRIVHDGSGADSRVLCFSLRGIEVLPVEIDAGRASGAPQS